MKISEKIKDYRLLVKVKTTSHEKIDEKELDRFSRAFLRCFLKPKLENKNTIEYSGPVGISLQERMKKAITKRDFLFILEHIVVAVQKLNANSFPLYNLKMDPQSIYVNETTKEMQFLYIPVTGASNGSNIIELINTVIYTARPGPEPDMEYVSRFNYYFKSIKPFDIDRVEMFVQREDPTVVNTVKKHSSGQSGFMTSDHKHYFEHLEKQEQNRDTEETALLDDSNATELLIEEQPVSAPVYNTVETYTPAPVSAPAVVDEDATGLLIEPNAAAFSAPENNVFETYTPAPAPASVDTEATGLLIEPDAAAFSAQVNNVFDTYTPDPAPVNQEVAGWQTEPNVATFNAPVNNAVDSEETTLLVAEEGTVLLDDTPPAVQPALFPELHRVKTGEIVKINKPVFRVGKERSYVDYFVTDNNAVSRSHADIITRGSAFFVVDLNSKNRTYINNVPLVVQQETPIKDGDMLRLGNEEFVFRLGSAATTPICPKCKAQVKRGSNFCTFCGCKL